MKKLLLLTILTIAFTGCTSCPSSKMLYGKYSYKENKKSFENDFIYIYPEGNYKHQFYSTNGQVYECKGKWTYDSLGCEILFEDFEFFNNQGSRGLPLGNWYSRIQVEDNNIKLMYSSEQNIHYSKAIEDNIKTVPVEYKGKGSATKELTLTGNEISLKLTYSFYKDEDELLVYDQKENELYRTGVKATTENNTTIINLSGET
jgi:hypothetical protein